MLPLDTQLLFLTTALLLALAPGPDNLFVMAQAAQHGARAGLLVTAGLCTGLLVHTAAVALGLAALFAASQLAFTLLTFAGAAYLLWLAWQAFHAGGSEAGDAALAPLPAGQLYRRGVLMNLSNPKVSIFFLAFLPQFADPARGPLAPQLLYLGGLFILATVVVFGALSLIAGSLGARLRQRPATQRWLNRAAGLLFLLLALRLLFGIRL
jgi:threonine/homoserine/homoserine lactone efflux protein